MRSDNLTRHSNTHTDLLSLTEEEVREELRIRQPLEADRIERTAKRQRLQDIAEEEYLIASKEIVVEKPLKEKHF